MIGNISLGLGPLRKLGGAAMLTAVLVGLASPGMTQTYPTRNITFVVGYAAGGTGDVIARLVAQKLSEALGKSVVVENRAGASGGIAAGGVARAEPDGHTILVGQSAEIAINPHLLKGLHYNPDKDLLPISLGAVVPLGLGRAGSRLTRPWRSWSPGAKSSQKGLSYATAGAGTPSHFAGELLKLNTQSNLTHVPYKGAGPALNDILGGHVDMYFSAVPWLRCRTSGPET